MKFRSIASPKTLLAVVLVLVPLAAHAQTAVSPPAVLQPGAGDLLSFGAIKVGPDAATIRFPALEAKGRVRGIKIVPQEKPCTIEAVTIIYRNGQVHRETVNAALKAGMPTEMFDARFDERFIETIDVTVKKGTCTGAMLEVLAAQGPDALADLRRPRTRSVSNETTASANLPYNPFEVYYGTSRKPGEPSVRGNNVKTLTYSSSPGPDVEFGKAIVSVPKTRPLGMGGPWYDTVIKSLSLPRDVLAKDFTMLGIEPMQEGPFVQAMRAKVAQATKFKGQAFVFVHGFFVTFDDAAFRAAQIATDMGFDGLPLVYSWPSAGRADSYKVDFPRAYDARESLARFLAIVARDSGATEVHLIAHSMGSVALIEALEWMQRGPGGAPKFSEIIFAAPDMLAEQFQRKTAQLRKFGRGITMYAAKNDRALTFSEIASPGQLLAGTIPRSGVPVLGEGHESIDVTALNTSYFAFNHSTFGDAEPLLKDMAAMFGARQRQAPDVRNRFFKKQPAPTTGGIFWRWEN